MRRIGFFLVVAFLLFTGAIGIRGAVDDWGKVDTLGKVVSTVFITAGGLLGIGAAVAVLARKSWAGSLILAWAVVMLSSGILASATWVWPGFGPMLVWLLVMSVLAGLTYWGWWVTAGPRSD